jgi:transcriptional regulator with XRE-family HTH domain
MADPESFKLALQGYAKSLLHLLRVCAGMTQKDLARRCGITKSLLSQWTSGACPMPPHHEKTLRHLLTERMHTMRASLAGMPPETLGPLQFQLIQALVALDGAVFVMEKEYAASVNRHAASAQRLHVSLPAATPSVHELADEAARQAYAAQAALPGLWRTTGVRNRRLHTLLHPDATADPRRNISALLDYADMVYGLAEGEAIEVKGPRHRKRGRPRKTVEQR